MATTPLIVLTRLPAGQSVLFGVIVDVAGSPINEFFTLPANEPSQLILEAHIRIDSIGTLIAPLHMGASCMICTAGQTVIVPVGVAPIYQIDTGALAAGITPENPVLFQDAEMFQVRTPDLESVTTAGDLRVFLRTRSLRGR